MKFGFNWPSGFRYDMQCPILSYFSLKHRLWVLVRTISLRGF